MRAYSLTATILLALLGPVWAQEAALTDHKPAEALFAHRVLPLLKSKCFACHGEDPAKIQGKFNMLTREGLLKGGTSKEPSIVPGDPDDSLLYLAVIGDGLAMPPKENDRLNDKQTGYIRDWIRGGAPWPTKTRLAEILRDTADKWSDQDGVPVKTSGGLSPEWTNRKYKPENLWEYQPLWTDKHGKLKDRKRNPIDILIEAKASVIQLPLAPPADRRALIRRATFDLIGLPPTPREIAAFERDPDSDAVAFHRVVERLLGSPHYGEQWGRHWLDVVRYADSSGYANDYERGNAWRYRDYVVRAFNEDKPYDQFIIEQIAGDEIYDAAAQQSQSSASATSTSLLIAAGFLRMGPWELTGMEVAKVARQRFLDDVTDAVGQVFLGHMLQCARCHDHKFDPVPTRDYYSMQAAFATTQFAERTAAFLPMENITGFDEKMYLEQRQTFYQKALAELDAKLTVEAAREWYAENGLDPTVFEEVVAELRGKQANGKVDVQKIRRRLAQRKVDPAEIPPRHVGFEPQDYGLERIARKGLQRLKWRMERYQPFAFSVYSGRTPQLKGVYAPLRMPKNPMKNGELEYTSILAGGDPFSPKEKVAPGVLSAVSLSRVDAAEQPVNASADEHPEPISGRRLKLAKWIASEDNPLTARVMVNRIWQWHFGRGIAANPNNFGTTGKKPTHPKLLDYLAGRFIKEGWSVKAMHRLIMSSQTYRRSSEHSEPKLLAERDPDGISYAAFQPRRLDAEELRDAMLMVSGELNPMIGGIPARPEINLEAALQPRMVMGTFAEAWQPSPRPKDRHRRSIYALRIRGQRDPFLEVFNAPTPDVSCEAREASTVTPQVFALFNSEITFDRALALANRLANETAREDVFFGQPAVLRRLFEIVYGRLPNEHEIELCVAHWKRMTTRHATLEFQPPTYPKQVTREAVEENTGEKFRFVEPLEFYADFIPDFKAADANPQLRGLAEVCLVLLNANEFVYLY